MRNKWAGISRCARLLFAALVLDTLACGGSEDAAAPTSNPLPVLLSVSPTQLVAGQSGASLTLTGSQFIPSSRARWNDGDRVTAYLNPTTLTIQLTAGDLAAIGIGNLTVVNPAPNGGTSGSLTVPVGYPVPTITSIAPNVLTAGAAITTVTVSGSGFVPQSSARWNSLLLIASNVTPTQLTIALPASFLVVGGTHRISIVNPPPAGGASNAVDFTIQNPVPQIAALNPDSALTGNAFTLSVVGTGFVATSRVRWNGSDRPTTFVSSTRLTVAVAGTDVATATTAAITVHNPEPGGGMSRSMPLRVRDAPPRIASVSPATITAGTAGVSIAINGSNFSTAFTVLWNGQPRAASFISSTSLLLTLGPADVSTPGTGRLAILNPGSSGSSNSIVIAILPSTPTLTLSGTLNLRNSDIVYDSTRRVLYASVPTNGGTYANSIVKIDPAAASVVGSVAVGSNPRAMDISDDGRFLYVLLGGAPNAVRVDLATFTKDIEFALGTGSFGALYGEDIVVIPGSSRSVAVSRANSCCSPRHEGVALYDDGVARTKTTQGHTGSNRITRGPTSTRLYGYNNETTEFGFRSIVVLPDGLTEEIVRPGLEGFGTDIEQDGGYVYSTEGMVVDVATMTVVGTVGAIGAVWPDAAQGRVHFLFESQIRTFHYTSFAAIGSFTHVSLANLARLKRWGSDGLAVGGADRIVFLRGSQVGQ